MSKLWIVLCLFLTACAWQSKPMQMGDGSYLVTANASPMRGGYTGAQEMALENANKQCKSMNKAIEVIDIKTQWGFPVNGVATIKFKCV